MNININAPTFIRLSDYVVGECVIKIKTGAVKFCDRDCENENYVIRNSEVEGVVSGFDLMTLVFNIANAEDFRRNEIVRALNAADEVIGGVHIVEIIDSGHLKGVPVKCDINNISKLKTNQDSELTRVNLNARQFKVLLVNGTGTIDILPFADSLGQTESSGADAETDPVAMKKIDSVILSELKNYYVSNTTGNDENDGLSWGTAKKSLSFLDTEVPKILAYSGQLIINLDETVAVQNADFYLDVKGFNGAGRIRFIGKQTSIQSGTVTDVNNSYDEFGRFKIKPNFALEPNTLNGLHIKFGNSNNKLYPVLKNDATFIYIAPVTYDLNNGDAFDVIKMTRFIGNVNTAGLRVGDNVLSYIEFKNIDFFFNAPSNNNQLALHNSGEISMKRCSTYSATLNRGSFTFYSTYIKTNYNTIADTSYYNKCVIDGGFLQFIAQQNSKLSIYSSLLANSTGFAVDSQGVSNNLTMWMYDVVFYENAQGIQMSKGTIQFAAQNRFIRCGGNNLAIGTCAIQVPTTANSVKSLHPQSTNIDCTYGNGVVSKFINWWIGGHPQSEEVSFSYWNGITYENETVTPINQPIIKSFSPSFLVNGGVNNIITKGVFLAEVYKVELLSGSGLVVATGTNLQPLFEKLTVDISYSVAGNYFLKFYGSRGAYTIPIEVKDATVIIPNNVDGDWYRVTANVVTGDGTFEVTTTSSGWDKAASFRDTGVNTVPDAHDFELLFNLFEATGASGNIMIGMDNSDPDANYNTIDYAFYIYSNNLRVYENGSAKGSTVSITPTDTDFKMTRIGDDLKYWYKTKSSETWNLLYDNTDTYTGPLVFDNSIYRYFGVENIVLTIFN